MRHPEIDLRLTPTLKHERKTKQLTLAPNITALHDLGFLVNTEAPRRPKLWLVHPDEEDYPDFYLRRDDERGIRAEVEVLDEKMITKAVAKALHEKAEARRQYDRRVLGNIAATGWSLGPLLAIGGTSTESGFIGAFGAGAALIGGALEWYKAKHPFEPQPMPELHDVDPVVRVLPLSE